MLLLLSSYRVIISKKRALMSAWSLWVSLVSVEGDAINGVASGSVRLYNSDFSFPSLWPFDTLSYVRLEILR